MSKYILAYPPPPQQCAAKRLPFSLKNIEGCLKEWVRVNNSAACFGM